jgi:hypothetical protein
MAFYSNHQIYPLVPRIIEVHKRVPWVRGRHSGTVGDIVAKLTEFSLTHRREQSQAYEVFVLSNVQDPETVDLGRIIENDQRSAKGRRSAFTQGAPIYVRLDEEMSQRLLKI